MTKNNAPQNGDFASLFDKNTDQSVPSTTKPMNSSTVHLAGEDQEDENKTRPQTIQDISNGEEPTDEFLENFNTLRQTPVSDEELERQALAHPGGDGDPTTPE